MKTEEFLAMSLPYGLYVGQYRHSKIECYNYYGLKKYEPYNKWIALIDDSTHADYQSSYTDGIYPILHPLSDLTKEIEHKGEKFIPMYILSKMQGFSVDNVKNWIFDFHDGKHSVASAHNGNWMLRYMVDEESFFLNGLTDWNKKHQKSRNQLSMFQKLIEWHFDIAGLIKKNEAIDVNTLSENPYK